MPVSLSLLAKIILTLGYYAKTLCIIFITLGGFGLRKKLSFILPALCFISMHDVKPKNIFVFLYRDCWGCKYTDS